MNYSLSMAGFSFGLQLAAVLCTLALTFALAGLLSMALGWLLKPRAPAYFIGWQEVQDGPAFELFNLTADIKGHPSGSTVSRLTLELAGYRVPAPSWRLFPKKAHE